MMKIVALWARWRRTARPTVLPTAPAVEERARARQRAYVCPRTSHGEKALCEVGCAWSRSRCSDLVVYEPFEGKFRDCSQS